MPVNLVVGRESTALVWLVALPIAVIGAGYSSGWSLWIVGILAGNSFLLAAVFKPPISLELSYAKTNEDDARVRIVVRRWKKVRVYSLDDLTNISISDYRTSVPLVYLVLSDGLAVGPLLRDPGAERFVLRLSEAMSAEGRGRDSFLWRQIQELLEYFRSTSSQ